MCIAKLILNPSLRCPNKGHKSSCGLMLSSTRWCIGKKQQLGGVVDVKIYSLCTWLCNGDSTTWQESQNATRRTPWKHDWGEVAEPLRSYETAAFCDKIAAVLAHACQHNGVDWQRQHEPNTFSIEKLLIKKNPFPPGDLNRLRCCKLNLPEEPDRLKMLLCKWKPGSPPRTLFCLHLRVYAQCTQKSNKGAARESTRKLLEDF